MTPAYNRPFHPIDLDSDEPRKFAMRALAEQLQREDSLSDSGRASLTLVHGPGLTVLLTAARAGTEFDEHDASGPTMLLVLSGQLSIQPGAGQAVVALGENDAFALGPDERVVVQATSDCTFLTIIGEQATASVTG